MSLQLTEEQVQATTIDGFQKMGYAVLQTTHRVKLAQCPECLTKFRPDGKYGSSKGVPDLLVSHPRWPKYLWLLIEMKRPEKLIGVVAGQKAPKRATKWKYSSSEQQELCESGRVAVATSWEEALAVTKRFEAEVVNALGKD
jgi:hypothetical protein